MHASIPFKHKYKSAKPDEIASATFSFKWLLSLESFQAHKVHSLYHCMEDCLLVLEVP